VDESNHRPVEFSGCRRPIVGQRRSGERHFHHTHRSNAALVKTSGQTDLGPKNLPETTYRDEALRGGQWGERPIWGVEHEGNIPRDRRQSISSIDVGRLKIIVFSGRINGVGLCTHGVGLPRYEQHQASRESA